MKQKTGFTFNGEHYELNAKQKLFCMNYVKLKFNGTQAALISGYSQKNAKTSATSLLSHPHIQRYLDALKRDVGAAIGVSAFMIAQEYARIGFSDIRKIFDENGNLIQIHNIADDPAANISSVEIFEVYTGTGDKREYIGQTKKIKLYDKVAALDKLAKMIGADGVSKTALTDTQGNDIKKDYSKLTDEELATLSQIQKKIE